MARHRVAVKGRNRGESKGEGAGCERVTLAPGFGEIIENESPGAGRTAHGHLGGGVGEGGFDRGPARPGRVGRIPRGEWGIKEDFAFLPAGQGEITTLSHGFVFSPCPFAARSFHGPFFFFFTDCHV